MTRSHDILDYDGAWFSLPFGNLYSGGYATHRNALANCMLSSSCSSHRRFAFWSSAFSSGTSWMSVVWLSPQSYNHPLPWIANCILCSSDAIQGDIFWPPSYQKISQSRKHRSFECTCIYRVNGIVVKHQHVRGLHYCSFEASTPRHHNNGLIYHCKDYWPVNSVLTWFCE